MKQAVLAIMLLLLLVQGAFGAVLLGGPETERGVKVSRDLVLKNNEGIVLENIAFGTTATGFNIEVEKLPDTLAVNEEATVTVTARIPHTLDSVNELCEAQAFAVGQLFFRADTVDVFQTFDLEAQAKNHLALEKLVLRVDDEGEIIEANDIKTGIYPGDPLELIARARNTFKESVKIEAVFTVDHPNEIDLDREDESADINENGKVDLQLLGAVRTDAKGQQEMVARLCGEDDNGALHGETIPFILDVERRRHHLRIMSFTANTDNAACNQNVNFNVEIVNVGDTNEKEAKLTLEQKELGISKDVLFSIDEEERKKIPISALIPETAPPGPYSFTARTHFANRFPSEAEQISIQINACEKIAQSVREVTLSPPEENEVIFAPEPVQLPPVEEKPIILEPKPSTNLGMTILISSGILGIVFGILLAYFLRR